MGFFDLFRSGAKWKHPNEKVRMKAVYKLGDQNILTEIAKTDPSVYIRKAAVKKLVNQVILAEIAQADSAAEVRIAAIEKLDDQDTLADIARTDSAILIRAKAVKKLDDQELLQEIAKADSESEVRKIAVNRLADLSVLVEVENIDDYIELSDKWVQSIWGPHQEYMVLKKPNIADFFSLEKIPYFLPKNKEYIKSILSSDDPQFNLRVHWTLAYLSHPNQNIVIDTLKADILFNSGLIILKLVQLSKSDNNEIANEAAKFLQKKVPNANERIEGMKRIIREHCVDLVEQYKKDLAAIIGAATSAPFFLDPAQEKAFQESVKKLSFSFSANEYSLICMECLYKQPLFQCDSCSTSSTYCIDADLKAKAVLLESLKSTSPKIDKNELLLRCIHCGMHPFNWWVCPVCDKRNHVADTLIPKIYTKLTIN